MTARDSRRSWEAASVETHGDSSQTSCPRMVGRAVDRLPIKPLEVTVASTGGTRMAEVVDRTKEKMMATMSPWTTMSSRAKWNEAGRSREIETRAGRTDETSLSPRALRMSQMRIRMRMTGTRASMQRIREIIGSSYLSGLTRVRGETGI